MKRTRIILAGLAVAMLCSSCAKTPTSGLNDVAKRYFDAWIQLHHPEAQKTFPGIYIIDDKPGSGVSIAEASEYPYIYIDYDVRDLDGNVTATTDPELSKQIGKYRKSDYHGPEVLFRTYLNVNTGFETMLSTMKVGGERTAVIPGWLTSSNRYNTEEEYLKRESGTDVIYNVKVREAIKDINKWQIDSIERYLAHQGMPTDSMSYGFYFIQTQAPTDTAHFEQGVNLLINYTGSLLNGKVFDTTIEKIAKDNDIFNASRSYESMTVTISENEEDNSDETTFKVVMDSGESSSDVIEGFGKGIMGMRAGEKATVIFYSPLGYKESATSSIPAYAPLRFDIEMIGRKP